MKKKYQFAAPGPYALQHGYSRVEVDENGVGEVDTNDAAMMRLVVHFGAAEIKETPKAKKEEKAEPVKAAVKKDNE